MKKFLIILVLISFPLFANDSQTFTSDTYPSSTVEFDSETVTLYKNQFRLIEDTSDKWVFETKRGKA